MLGSIGIAEDQEEKNIVSNSLAMVGEKMGFRKSCPTHLVIVELMELVEYAWGNWHIFVTIRWDASVILLGAFQY